MIKIEYKDCPECGGSGRVENPIYKNNPDPNLWRGMDCPTCKYEKQIKSGYIIIDDPRQASCFIGKEVTFLYSDNCMWINLLYSVSEDGFEDDNGNNAEKIKVHYTTFKKTLKDGLNRKILLHGLSEEERAEWE